MTCSARAHACVTTRAARSSRSAASVAVLRSGRQLASAGLYFPDREKHLSPDVRPRPPANNSRGDNGIELRNQKLVLALNAIFFIFCLYFLYFQHTLPRALAASAMLIWPRQAAPEHPGSLPFA